MATAITLNSIFLVILFCGSAVGTRPNLFPFKSQAVFSATSPAANDGLCTTFVTTQGYACEEHKVTTQDGYILSVQRIPEGKSGGSAGNRPPVLLQHGLLAHGACWLVLPPDQALGFLLADNGFDVWIANSRGTKYSSGHTSPSPEEDWLWSWDELVAYDLSAVFQYVFNETGQKLHYVGHSQGTLMSLAALSKNQQLDMWRSAALLAPISYLDQIGSPLVRAAAEIIVANESFWLAFGEFSVGGEAVARLLVAACSHPGVDCSGDLATAISGKDCCQDPSAQAALVREAQPSAMKNIVHLSQMVTEGTIAMYDYNNTEENKKNYGQPTPPTYNLESIPTDFPLFLSHGGQDLLSYVEDVKHLLDTLKNHVPNQLVVQYIPKYGHGDFLIAVNAKQTVYDPLIAFLKAH